MMLALVFASEDESYELRKVLGKNILQRVGNIDVYVYKINNHIFYLFHTGIGKVNAASALSKISSFFSIDYVLNVGTAGGIGDGINIADLVIAKEIVYHDVDLTSFNHKRGQLPDTPELFKCENVLTECCLIVLSNQSELKLHEGLLATGDQFIDQSNLQDIKKWFPKCIAVDMEAAAYAHVCNANKIIFTSLKIISDLPKQEQNVEDYSQTLANVSKKIAKFVPEIVKYVLYTKNIN